MVYAVAALLASSLTAAGLLVAWAATSPAHWFWRTEALLAASLPLLVASATEPLAAFAIQATIVTVGTRWLPWDNATSKAEAAGAFRFAMRDLLLLCVPISVVAASARYRTPSLNPEALQTVVLIGVAGGLVSFTGWWIGSKKAKLAWIRVLVGLLVWGSTAAVLARCDWFVFCFENLGEWPPDQAGGTWGFYGRYNLGDRVNAWYAILATQLLLTVWVTRGFVAPADASCSWKRRIWRRLSCAGSLVLFALALIPTLHVGYKFLTRHPTPDVETPEQNGYLDLVDATQLLPSVRLVEADGFYLWEADEAQLQAAVAELGAALDRAGERFGKPSSATVDYRDGQYPYSLIDDFSTLMRGLAAQARLAKLSGDIESAADRFLEILALANTCCRGGLAYHGDKATHFDYVAYRGFYHLLDELPGESLPDYASRLHGLELDREPPEQLVRRSEAWAQRSRGWYGHLMYIYGLRYHYRLFELQSHLYGQRDSTTISRLLRADIAIRRFKSHKGGWPEKLDSLIPEYLSAVPVDPCSRRGEHLRYLLRDDSYLLYSVGPDGEDDHGQESTMSLSYAVHGDTSLGDLFDERPED
ncbi:MAG: hypothetical protein AAF266_12285 [Planctomycetota bacterium]